MGEQRSPTLQLSQTRPLLSPGAHLFSMSPDTCPPRHTPPSAASLRALKLLFVYSITPDTPLLSSTEKRSIMILWCNHFLFTLTPRLCSDTSGKPRLLRPAPPGFPNPTMNTRWVTPVVLSSPTEVSHLGHSVDRGG